MVRTENLFFLSKEFLQASLGDWFNEFESVVTLVKHTFRFLKWIFLVDVMSDLLACHFCLLCLVLTGGLFEKKGFIHALSAHFAVCIFEQNLYFHLRM